MRGVQFLVDDQGEKKAVSFDEMVSLARVILAGKQSKESGGIAISPKTFSAF